MLDPSPPRERWQALVLSRTAHAQCPFCGATDWEALSDVLGHQVGVLQEAGGGSGGPREVAQLVASVTVACARCGFLRSHIIRDEEQVRRGPRIG